MASILSYTSFYEPESVDDDFSSFEYPVSSDQTVFFTLMVELKFKPGVGFFPQMTLSSMTYERSSDLSTSLEELTLSLPLSLSLSQSRDPFSLLFQQTDPEIQSFFQPFPFVLALMDQERLKDSCSSSSFTPSSMRL